MSICWVMVLVDGLFGRKVFEYDDNKGETGNATDIGPVFVAYAAGP